MKHLLTCNRAFCIACGVFATILTLVHPVLHGTPLDGGVLDSLLPLLQSQANNR